MELIVVIAIISMLSSIILSSLGKAKQKGSDAAKIRSIQEVKKALAMYYSDNKYYPTITDALTGTPKYINVIAPGIQYSGRNVNKSVCVTLPCPSYVLYTVLQQSSPVLQSDSDYSVGTTFYGNSATCVASGGAAELCYDVTP